MSKALNKFIFCILLLPGTLFAQNLLDNIESNSKNIHEIRKSTPDSTPPRNEYLKNSGIILSGGNKEKLHINFKRVATDQEREMMVRSIMTSAVINNKNDDQTFSDYYKNNELYEGDSQYMRHMAAVYFTYTITRDFHKMLELKTDYVVNFREKVNAIDYWVEHFNKDSARIDYKPYIRNFIKDSLLDKILTSNFANIYASINEGCKDVTKEWYIRENVTPEEVDS